MKIVEKYLWRSVLVPLLFVIAALFTLWLTFDIFDKVGRLIEKGPPVWLLAKYFLVQLPDLAQSILPPPLVLGRCASAQGYSAVRRDPDDLDIGKKFPIALDWEKLIW